MNKKTIVIAVVFLISVSLFISTADAGFFGNVFRAVKNFFSPPAKVSPPPAPRYSPPPAPRYSPPPAPRYSPPPAPRYSPPPSRYSPPPAQTNNQQTTTKQSTTTKKTGGGGNNLFTAYFSNPLTKYLNNNNNNLVCSVNGYSGYTPITNNNQGDTPQTGTSPEGNYPSSGNSGNGNVYVPPSLFFKDSTLEYNPFDMSSIELDNPTDVFNPEQGNENNEAPSIPWQVPLAGMGILGGLGYAWSQSNRRDYECSAVEQAAATAQYNNLANGMYSAGDKAEEIGDTAMGASVDLMSNAWDSWHDGTDDINDVIGFGEATLGVFGFAGGIAWNIGGGIVDTFATAGNAVGAVTMYPELLYPSEIGNTWDYIYDNRNAALEMFDWVGMIPVIGDVADVGIGITGGLFAEDEATRNAYKMSIIPSILIPGLAIGPAKKMFREVGEEVVERAARETFEEVGQKVIRKVDEVPGFEQLEKNLILDRYPRSGHRFHKDVLDQKLATGANVEAVESVVHIRGSITEGGSHRTVDILERRGNQLVNVDVKNWDFSTATEAKKASILETADKQLATVGNEAIVNGRSVGTIDFVEFHFSKQPPTSVINALEVKGVKVVW